jgi:hypothetical protein
VKKAVLWDFYLAVLMVDMWVSEKVAKKVDLWVVLRAVRLVFSMAVRWAGSSAVSRAALLVALKVVLTAEKRVAHWVVWTASLLVDLKVVMTALQMAAPKAVLWVGRSEALWVVKSVEPKELKMAVN